MHDGLPACRQGRHWLFTCSEVAAKLPKRESKRRVECRDYAVETVLVDRERTNDKLLDHGSKNNLQAIGNTIELLPIHYPNCLSGPGGIGMLAWYANRGCLKNSSIGLIEVVTKSGCRSLASIWNAVIDAISN